MFVQIPGFERYLINECGDVISAVGGCWKPLKPGLGGNGYLTVSLYTGPNAKAKTKAVHRLMLLAWKVGPVKEQVNHKNGIKTDNRLENLEYCSRSQNSLHAYRLGLCEKARVAAAATGRRNAGENQGGSKLTDTQAVSLFKLKGSMSQGSAATLFGISRAQVGRIWQGKSRKHIHQEVLDDLPSAACSARLRD